jgi:trimethylamine--corrinoid protein Co-methyltransferase
MRMSEIATAQSEGRSRRRGRGTEHVAAHSDHPIRPQPRLPVKPVAIVSADQLEAVHQAALKILKEIGVDVLNADARRRRAIARPFSVR